MSLTKILSNKEKKKDQTAQMDSWEKYWKRIRRDRIQNTQIREKLRINGLVDEMESSRIDSMVILRKWTWRQPRLAIEYRLKGK